LSRQHFTRTLPGVEPIASAISAADCPCSAKRRIIRTAAGVKMSLRRGIPAFPK
jgi:hypothetical protein